MILAQLSDAHIKLEKGRTIPDQASSDRLQQAVAHIMALPARPDALIITGDCVETGQRAEYDRFREILRPLPIPVYVVPGNHDNRVQLLDLFGSQGAQPLAGSAQYVIDDWPLRLIALDTLVQGRGYGALGAERLQWLADRLAEAPTRPTLIFMHHPPFQTGLVPFDQIGLVDADAFGALISSHTQVERIVTGHVHMAAVRRFAGTVVMTCPAIAYTLVPDMNQPDRVAVLQEPPACLIHVWREHTGLVTYTSLIGTHGPVIELHDGTHWVE